MTTGESGAEPSMEDILSSIKRIIAEDGDAGAAARPMRRAPPRPFPSADIASAIEPATESEATEAPPVASVPPDMSPASPPPGAVPPPADLSPRTVSDATVEATRDALGSLSRLVVKPAPGSDGTLEGLVRDMIRPLISAWLDQNLPRLVQEQVAREIAKITAQQG